MVLLGLTSGSDSSPTSCAWRSDSRATCSRGCSESRSWSTGVGVTLRVNPVRDLEVDGGTGRLSPEYGFPAAAEDCQEAFRWLMEHADEVDADPARLAVGGDSAGGWLPAPTAVWAAEQEPQGHDTEIAGRPRAALNGPASG